MRSVARIRRGFSLLELIIVLGIMLSVSVVAMPRFITYVSMYRLRNTMSQGAGFLQQTRMQAVRLNRVLSVSTGTANGERIAWVNLPGGTANWDSGEPFLQLTRGIQVNATGHPGDATTGLGYTAQSSSTAVTFNARGLPCVYPTGSVNCENYDSSNTRVGFVIYFQNTGIFGVTNWGAITITPAGRIRSWVWNGGSYSGQ